MAEVVVSIRRVTDLMGETRAASAEQSAGVAPVGEAITQMDQATQQNAALVEEAAAASESMKEQAGNLSESVEQFKMSEVAQGAGARSDGAERRGPHRATNISRLAPAQAAARPAVKSPAARPAARPAALAATGTHGADSGDWEQF